MCVLGLVRSKIAKIKISTDSSLLAFQWAMHRFPPCRRVHRHLPYMYRGLRPLPEAEERKEEKFQERLLKLGAGHSRTGIPSFGIFGRLCHRSCCATAEGWPACFRKQRAAQEKMISHILGPRDLERRTRRRDRWPGRKAESASPSPPEDTV